MAPELAPTHVTLPEDRRREKNRTAQSRYRALKKEADLKAQQHLQSLATSIAELTAANMEMCSRERLMTELVQTQESFIDRISADERVLSVQQDMLLCEAMLTMSEVYGRSIDKQEAMSWTLEAWITNHFENFLTFLAANLPKAWADPNGPEAQQLAMMVLRRREAELRLTLFSCLHLAIYGWNLEYGPGLACPATQDTWRATLAGLQLSLEQQQQILQARRGALLYLEKAQERRVAAYAALQQEAQAGVMQTESAQCRGSSVLPCPQCTPDRAPSEGAAMLETALQTERKAVNVFLTRVTQDILGPLQEAWLDACAPTRPWCPDWWLMAGLLAQRHKEPQAPDFPDLLTYPPLPNIQALMPLLPAFQLLITPCTAKGSGGQLKRGLLNCSCITVRVQSPIGGVLYQMPSMQSLQGMTLVETQAGKYRQHWPVAASARSSSQELNCTN
ncbi:hypothetical protein WJX73_006351 [Symbiochloris irregularis]|uniref:BZIP domain-containing protein n=1 Tax=Symbiochloris irregularis TaxID=706552 RepID=A0AAW1NUZ4_9CHLO